MGRGRRGWLIGGAAVAIAVVVGLALLPREDEFAFLEDLKPQRLGRAGTVAGRVFTMHPKGRASVAAFRAEDRNRVLAAAAREMKEATGRTHVRAVLGGRAVLEVFSARDRTILVTTNKDMVGLPAEKSALVPKDGLLVMVSRKPDALEAALDQALRFLRIR
jgi:hypothetical protein